LRQKTKLQGNLYNKFPPCDAVWHKVGLSLRCGHWIKATMELYNT